MSGVKIVAGVLVIIVLGLAGYTILKPNTTSYPKGTPTVEQPISDPRRGYGHMGGGPPSEVGNQPLAIVPSGKLSEEERKSILYMREEEKLARDVYLIYV